MPKARIEHFVVLMLENRSFDHIFGYRTSINGLKGNEFNLLDPAKPESDTNPALSVSNGAPFAVPAGQGPGHSIEQTNRQLFNSKTGPVSGQPSRNNGFVRSYSTELFGDHVTNPTRDQLQVVMESFAPARLPALNMLADHFCVCDRWHSEVPGPTEPNRLYVHAATSVGFGHNVWSKTFDVRTIYENLQARGFTWATYEFDHNEVRSFTRINHDKGSFKAFDAFKGDVQQETLANYSFIQPRFMNAQDGMANSQHAPEDVRYGDNLIADVYDTLRSNDAVWNKSVLIVVYDEHGGFYDHVAPPAAVNPDGINSPPPGDKASFAPRFAFDRLGVRVPAVIASPWIKKGTVESALLQHTSIAATLKEMFGLPHFLSKRDAGAHTLSHLFSLGSLRTDTPMKLRRAALPQITITADHSRHPMNHRLDETQREMVLGVYHLTQASDPDGLSVDDLPITKNEASKFIRARYVEHFGPLAGPGEVARRAAAGIKKK